MIRIGLIDSDNTTYPNLALMKLATYHRADEVEWFTPGQKYDRIYASKVMDFKADPLLPPDTIKGGTGFLDLPIANKLPDEIERCRPDYSIYPACNYAIGFVTRGCPNQCSWCIVPDKEGAIRAAAEVKDLIRPDSNQLLIMDNNILAHRHGLEQLKILADEPEVRVDINQGLDARLMDKYVVCLLSRLRWIKYIRMSCDQLAQVDNVAKAVHLLREVGFPTYKIFIYLLVTADVEDAAKRVDLLRKLGNITIYAQMERNKRKGVPAPTALQKLFAYNYIWTGVWRKVSWEGFQKVGGMTK